MAGKQEQAEARAMLGRLKTFEEWSKDEEVMALVQSVFGSPQAFYAQFKSTLEDLCERPDQMACAEGVEYGQAN